MLAAVVIDGWFLGFAGLALGLASFVQGFSGFGGGIVAVSLLSLMDTVVDATALTNLCAAAITGGILWQLRGHVQWRMVWPLLAGQAVALPVGVWFLATADDVLARRVMGLLVVGFAGWSLWRRDRRGAGPMGWLSAAGVGTAAGLMSGAFCMSGPPLIAYIYSRDLARDALKATIQICFVFSVMLRLVIVGSVGHLTGPILLGAVLLMPAILVGTLVGLRLARRISTEPFRQLAWMLFAGLGLLLWAR